MTVAIYIVRRVAVLAASVACASVAVFLLMAVLPGDATQVALGTGATPEAIAAGRHEFGLDRPLLVRYSDWAGGLFTGHFGISHVTDAAIAPQVFGRLSVTLWLGLGGMAVALLIAIPAGTIAAVRHRRLLGTAVSASSQVGIAIPAFLAGIVLVYVFAVVLRVLPSGGYVPLTENPAEWFRHLLLAWLSLGLVQGAVVTRYVRAAVLDVTNEDYIRTAQAKGRTRMSALWRHGRRNAAIPVVTVLGLQLATLLIGAVVVERVFVIPGLGDLLLTAVGDRDLQTVQDVAMVLVVAILLLNFLVDTAYAVIDPRLRRAR